MKTGIELISEERKRQVEQEGWTPEHDDGHTDGELIEAARAYALYAEALSFPHTDTFKDLMQGRTPHDWPWSSEWWKPSQDKVRNLVKAGALIAAEIDRLQRKETECQWQKN